MLQPFLSLIIEFNTGSNISISKVIIAMKQLHTCLKLNSENLSVIKLKQQIFQEEFMFSETAEGAKTLVIDQISDVADIESTSFKINPHNP